MSHRVVETGQNSTCRTLPSAMATATAAILARAFQEDPFFRWADPNPARRLRLMTTVFGALLELAAEHGEALIEPDIGAVEWRAPEHIHLGFGAVLWSGMWRVALVSPPSVWRRLSAHEAWAMNRARPHLTAGSVYLGTLGVDPSLAGQGHGGRLLDRALDEMARQHWKQCVLRTEQPRNVSFYRRHGFTLLDEAVVPASGLRVWVFSIPLAPRPQE